MEHYDPAEVEASHAVLIDAITVLGRYADQLVVVGGWVPELTFPHQGHLGSLDVDHAVIVFHLETPSPCRRAINFPEPFPAVGPPGNQRRLLRLQILSDQVDAAGVFCQPSMYEDGGVIKDKDTPCDTF